VEEEAMYLSPYFVAAMALSTIMVASPSSAVDVTVCGQEIPAGEVGVLTADLDCSGMAGSNAVQLGVGASATPC
jgi:hypothetical protein